MVDVIHDLLTRWVLSVVKDGREGGVVQTDRPVTTDRHVQT